MEDGGCMIFWTITLSAFVFNLAVAFVFHVKKSRFRRPIYVLTGAPFAAGGLLFIAAILVGKFGRQYYDALGGPSTTLGLLGLLTVVGGTIISAVLNAVFLIFLIQDKDGDPVTRNDNAKQ